MTLEFSASQVSALLSCRRKYYYSSVQRLDWPEPFDRDYLKADQLTRMGSEFHLTVQRVAQGLLPIERAISNADGEIQLWLQRFRDTVRLPAEGTVYAEMRLTMRQADVLWNGKIDLLTVDGGGLTIYDWKTARKAARREACAAAPQTGLYRALAVENRVDLGLPADVFPRLRMAYWFANFPDRPIEFDDYSEAAYREDLRRLEAYAALMRSEDEADYPRTQDLKTCSWCRYRTYCRPEGPPGAFDEADFEPEPDDFLFPPDNF